MMRQLPPRRRPHLHVPSWPLCGTLALNLCFIVYHSWQLWQGAPATHVWGVLFHCLAGGCVWGLYRLARGA
jgi:hypothetical protein